jgi:hypothetical protein
MQQELTVLNSLNFDYNLPQIAQIYTEKTKCNICAYLCNLWQKNFQCFCELCGKKDIAVLFLLFTGKEYGFTVKYLSYKHQSEYLSGRI